MHIQNNAIVYIAQYLDNFAVFIVLFNGCDSCPEYRQAPVAE